MAELLKGAPVAKAITEDLKRRSEELIRKGVRPRLAILRVGNREDDLSYERGAMKRCEKAGIGVTRLLLPEDCSGAQLSEAIQTINQDYEIHGCLMFRPLPDRKLEERACEQLYPAKDVDCMTSGSLATVFAGRGEGYAPCTAQACIELLDYYGIDLTGRRVTVIGRSLVIGKPVSMMLQARNATVTMCHTKTVDLPAVCRDAEILVAAAGKAGLVTSEFVRPGQTVIDVGINVDDDGRLCGDVAFSEVEPIAAAITPVPSGVGSVTTAVLAKHVIEGAEKTLYRKSF
ncbi:MAG: bifunctional 5,10-methylene-tetrahydrofolate dehydrogenase/5,10-methylene-tetrahydrofolate cyclohydrolase [Lachnospiraceae bacterium]|jgi:methylenetetrahydrofolate dehydrogenase (NADP+)/methenyltetrahydrofolate cyclohydrolase|nr:bifunctional 5,10-methylene-tetrahydrofolate dehydrogenase/5,10-methylene-tetrahydrofolate cyclohydrolase [Lachnospiraceae bacterium]MCI1329080.1 bifunctional 5,10-methylene-tetrahydrofolate dehydrogenase/5,10-methylene-tetrahydrofolate cyclohydrolase [Lachnospiraceae bacterium]